LARGDSKVYASKRALPHTHFSGPNHVRILIESKSKRPLTPPDQYTEPFKEHVTLTRSRLKGNMHLRDELDLPVKYLRLKGIPKPTAYDLLQGDDQRPYHQEGRVESRRRRPLIPPSKPDEMERLLNEEGMEVWSLPLIQLGTPCRCNRLASTVIVSPTPWLDHYPPKRQPGEQRDLG
jgi:hypothetical protein